MYHSLEHGSQIHGLSIKLGHESDIYVATALVTMYSNCRELGLAQQVCKMITGKSIVSYNAMISGFSADWSLFHGLGVIQGGGKFFYRETQFINFAQSSIHLLQKSQLYRLVKRLTVTS